MGIEITEKEKHALMKRLDDDADGEISYEEFY
jgi:Ca2+-binding EF-hand superfamily protein